MIRFSRLLRVSGCTATWGRTNTTAEDLNVCIKNFKWDMHMWNETCRKRPEYVKQKRRKDMHIYVYLSIRICTYVHIYIQKYTKICEAEAQKTYTYICIYIHTYMYIRTYIYTQRYVKQKHKVDGIWSITVHLLSCTHIRIDWRTERERVREWGS